MHEEEELEGEPRVTEYLDTTLDPKSARPLLTFVTKRTYSFEGGKLALADEQQPLVFVPRLDDAEEGLTTLLDDSDFVPPKLLTDVVVTGFAEVREPVRECYVAVAAGSMARRLRVMGEREVEVRPDGTVRFTTAKPFTRVPLVWSLAYGGYDGHAREALAPPDEPYGVDDDGTIVSAPKQRGVFAYPRNSSGLGYFADFERPRASGARLPQIEDPVDPLVPERFFVPTPVAWIDAPIPGAFGWLHYAWYPRFARLFGRMLEYELTDRPIREIVLGCGEDLAELSSGALDSVDPRSLQGAAPGLATKLRGDELVVLAGMRAGEAEQRFYLPGEAPRVELKLPDTSRVVSPAPRLQTVRVDAERGLVALTWCAAAPMLHAPEDAWVQDCRVRVDWRAL